MYQNRDQQTQENNKTEEVMTENPLIASYHGLPSGSGPIKKSYVISVKVLYNFV